VHTAGRWEGWSSLIQGNVAQLSGGGVAMAGEGHLIHSTLSFNTASLGDGGGVRVSD